MARTVVKQIPRQLHPRGEHIIRIMYDDNEPPKNYIWGIDDGLFEWNGKEWVPFELNKHGKHHHGYDHGCDHDDSSCNIDSKFEKFKKETLAAVLRLIKQQVPDGDAALADRIVQLETDVAALKQINHDLFVKNSELEDLIDELQYAKKSEVNTATSALSDRISTLENTNFVTSDQLQNYATQTYVDTVATNLNVPRRTSQLTNDSGYISGVEIINSPNITVLNGNSEFNMFTGFGTATDLQNRVTLQAMRAPFKLNVTSGSNYDDSELRGRVETLENAGFVTGQDVDNTEFVVASSLNNLNDRVLSLENNN